MRYIWCDFWQLKHLLPMCREDMGRWVGKVIRWSYFSLDNRGFTTKELCFKCSNLFLDSWSIGDYPILVFSHFFPFLFWLITGEQSFFSSKEGMAFGYSIFRHNSSSIWYAEANGEILCFKGSHVCFSPFWSSLEFFFSVSF